LYFSENFRPHTWPAEYAMTVEHPIVGLGVFGNTCVVCTTGRPAAVTGIKPTSMSLVSHTTSMPCLSRKSIVSTPDGVIFASESGIVGLGPSGITNFTGELFGREVWRTTYAAETMWGILVEGAYVALYRPGGIDKSFMFRPGDVAHGVTENFLPLPTGTYIGLDQWSGKPWILFSEHSLCEWMKPGSAPLTYRWRSGELTFPKPLNLAVGQLFFSGANVALRIWADGRQVFNSTITSPIQPFRLPSGFKGTIFQFEVEGVAELHGLALCSTMAELRLV
jgi:hypothetical protein